MIKVFHRIDSDYWTPAKRFVEKEFRAVAEVETVDLEKAFNLTNTIEHYWWENAGVKALVDRTRSTSIGDVMEMNGEYFTVDRIGFKKIDVAEKGEEGAK